MAKLLKTRLISRGYPIKLIDKTTATVQYEARDQLLSASKKSQPRFNPPVYKCLLPPQFTVLKTYHTKKTTVGCNPWFLPQGLFPYTLKNELIRVRLSPTDEQLVDVLMSLQHQDTSNHTIAGHLPVLRPTVKTQKCEHPRCATCKHLHCSKTVKCSRTGTSYPIRQSFSYTSNKPYLSQSVINNITTKKLNIGINHHRTNIFSKHFNLPDHSVDNLSVQAIDCIQHDQPKRMKATGYEHYKHYNR